MSTSICLKSIYMLFYIILVIHGEEMEKEAIDKVIEDEITQKLSEDLLQSIEKKFQVDLERSVDSVLTKIKVLLQNGTTHIQDKLVELQGVLDLMKRDGPELVDDCLLKKQNETAALAEKALHQMVVCGYALIGHDPAQAMRNVIELKNMISTGLKPVYEQRTDVYSLIKICGHDHDSLKKVIKCVISKSPQIKSAMMGVSAKLVDGVVQLTKLMAHGAMHEACLIEVIRTVEDEAFVIVKKVKKCVDNRGNVADDKIEPENVNDDIQKLLTEGNATVLDIDMRTKDENNSSKKESDVQNEQVLVTEPKVEMDASKLLEPMNYAQQVTVSTTNDVSSTVDKKSDSIREEVREEMKKLLRRMMGDSTDEKLKLRLLKELERESSNNLDGKV